MITEIKGCDLPLEAIMKKEITTKIIDKVFDVKENHVNVNRFVKAVIVNFGDERGDIIVENDNFGTRRKYADFTEGKKKAGLNPMQIVFSGLEMARICGERYINRNGEICIFD
jgi:hypothetical protein